MVARFAAMASDQQTISGLNKLKLTCDHFSSCIYHGGSLVNNSLVWKCTSTRRKNKRRLYWQHIALLVTSSLVSPVHVGQDSED